LLLLKERKRRKPSGFQRFATTLPGKFTLSLQNVKAASICCVKALDRAGSPIFALFLASHCRLLRHCGLIYEGVT